MTLKPGNKIKKSTSTKIFADEDYTIPTKNIRSFSKLLMKSKGSFAENIWSVDWNYTILEDFDHSYKRLESVEHRTMNTTVSKWRTL